MRCECGPIYWSYSSSPTLSSPPPLSQSGSIFCLACFLPYAHWTFLQSKVHRQFACLSIDPSGLNIWKLSLEYFRISMHVNQRAAP